MCTVMSDCVEILQRRQHCRHYVPVVSQRINAYRVDGFDVDINDQQCPQTRDIWTFIE